MRSHHRPYFREFDPASVPSPCFVVDRAAVRWNLQVLQEIGERSGAKVLIALKAFALPAVFDLIRTHLDGACASGLHEARFAREQMEATGDRSVHTYSPAYKPEEFEDILQLSDHVIFNSLGQWSRFRNQCLSARAAGNPVVFGLRVNPECPTSDVALYDPCAPGSRLGMTEVELRKATGEAGGTGRSSAAMEAVEGGRLPREIEELHIHTLCEDDSLALESTLDALEDRFGDFLRSERITTLNLGGGHHITRPDYDRDHLVQLIQRTKQRYSVDVILEPGEAVALGSGVLVSTVLDVGRNRIPHAILDTSATTHMPDVLEMPYRPHVWNTTDPGEIDLSSELDDDDHGFVYRLGGQSCLAGDVIGDYCFEKPLQPGDRIILDDMSHYTMVKTTTFNGVPLPAIAVYDSEADSAGERLTVVRRFGYDEFRRRLG
ncbi:MAG: carboxynorspermidine decarboxylase [bacterium]